MQLVLWKQPVMLQELRRQEQAADHHLARRLALLWQCGEGTPVIMEHSEISGPPHH